MISLLATCDRNASSNAALDDDRSSAPQVKSAEFGVFFGGQIQERQRIPFEIDPTKQRHGFRLTFSQPLRTRTVINWELDMPGGAKNYRDPAGRRGKGRLVKLGDATLEAGQASFEQPMRFRPGDPLGLWNIRVVLAERVLIDRSFEVYNPQAVPGSGAVSDGGL